MLHHNLSGAAREYERDLDEAMYRLYTSVGFGEHSELPEITSLDTYIDKKDITWESHPCHSDSQNVSTAKNNQTNSDTFAVGIWRRLPRKKSMPHWLSREDASFLCLVLFLLYVYALFSKRK